MNLSEPLPQLFTFRKPFFRRTAAIILAGSAVAALLPASARSEPTPSALFDSGAYTFGTVIRCTSGGAFEKMKGSGWSTSEEKFTWTEGSASTLLFTLPASDRALKLRMRLAGMVKAPDLAAQPVEVFANDKKIAEWRVSESTDQTATVPGELVQAGGPLKIMLKIPKAASPKALGVSADVRVLGVCCWEFDLTQI